MLRSACGGSGQTTVEYVMVLLLVAIILALALAAGGIDEAIRDLGVVVAGVITNAVAP